MHGLNNDSKSEETCFVYISYFLIVSTLIDEKLFKIFEKEKSLLKNQSFLNCLYKSEYCSSFTLTFIHCKKLLFISTNFLFPLS